MAFDGVFFWQNILQILRKVLTFVFSMFSFVVKCSLNVMFLYWKFIHFGEGRRP